MTMEVELSVPPGFRFHPTEEELVGYYLRRKIASQKIDLQVIMEIDLYKIEPWELQDRCNLGYEEQKEWYFFSHKDKKYPSGTRTNRATIAGFWKATGRDKAVVSKSEVIGMRKTLVFYQGRAPNGRKTDWIIHEFRLQSSLDIEHPSPQEEEWVVCRAFRKPSPTPRQCFTSFNYPAHHLLHQNHNDYSSPEIRGSFCYESVLEAGAEKEENSHGFELPKLEIHGSSSRKSSHHGGKFVELKFFDELLATQFSESASSSSSVDYAMKEQNHGEYYLDYLL